MQPQSSYTIFSLGDAALIIDFGNCINEQVNRKVQDLFQHFKAHPLPGMIEAVPAYSSLTLHYDITIACKGAPAGLTGFEWIKQQTEQWLTESRETTAEHERLVRIPVCYETAFAPDMALLAAVNQVSVEEIIRLHTATAYRVYMLGFLPGFAYMGEVDERISIPRKSQPAQVAAGSVGIAGRQTGIYPLDSPGGWVIIGRTPVRLFDAAREQPAYLQPGDRVQFYSISSDEFAHY